MTLEQMRVYLQEYHGVPITLRQQGTTTVKCPYCLKTLDHGPDPGHHVAGCYGDDRSKGISINIGDRHFIPSYGYVVLEYREVNGVNELLSLD
jgi:hypothetical protein